MTAYRHPRRLSGSEQRSPGVWQSSGGAIALFVSGQTTIRVPGVSTVLRRLGLLVACVAGAALAMSLAGESGEPVQSAHSGVQALARTAHTDGLSTLPLAARGPVSAALGAAEAGYRITGLRASNPAQALRLTFATAGVTVASGSHSIRMSVMGIGRSGALRPVTTSRPVADGNRVRYARAGLNEWYANGPLGLEQGFTVSRRPARGAGPLVLSLSLAGNLHARLDGDDVVLSGAGTLLRYGGLSAVDAGGRPVRSWLSVHGRTLSIGVADRGARYPLRIDPYVQQGSKLIGSGATGNAHQGYNVAVSSNGNTALIGGPYDLAGGAAWVFTRSNGTWSQQGPKLTGFDADGNAQFGASVALSNDGNTALIGGPADGLVGGAAWVFTRSGSTWTQNGPKLIGDGADGDAQQGQSVALSGDGKTALVGGPHDNRSLGATWVFTRSGSTWTQQGLKLVGSPPGTNSLQGWSVALSGDGNTALVAGINYVGGGAAWVFTRTGGVWSQAGSQLLPKPRTTLFGRDVALSNDGNTAIIGSPGANNYTGGAFVFVPFNGNRNLWVQQAELVGQGTGGFGAAQGYGVSLSADGNTALVGGPDDPNSNSIPYQGATWVFTRAPATPTSGPTWSQLGSKLLGSGGTLQPSQGWSVALSGDATTAIVGGPGDNSDTGAVWAFSTAVSATPPGRPKLHLAIAGARNVTAGKVTTYRITVSRTQRKGTRAAILKNVQVVTTHAGHRVQRWSLATLAPGKKRTVHLSLRISASARGSFCITTRASAKNALGALARHCTPVKRR